MHKSLKYFKNMKYFIYLKYLRYRIGNIKCIEDIINIMNNICLFYGNLNNDSLIEILNDCLNKHPLNEKELQTISLIQQKYDTNLGIENFVSMVLWCSILYSINEKENNEKENKEKENNEKENNEKENNEKESIELDIIELHNQEENVELNNIQIEYIFEKDRTCCF
tara:strand:- start:4284 stop:4784 length:501 start_codon:yes stop_codon:yes gene_type:complete